MRGLVIFLWLPLLQADEQTQKMMARVSEEAEAFRTLAPKLLGVMGAAPSVVEHGVWFTRIMLGCNATVVMISVSIRK